MTRFRGWPVLALLALGLGLTSGDPPASDASRHRGMSYAHRWGRAESVGYGTEASAASLGRLRALGVTWISVTPFGFQTTPGDTSIRWGPNRFSETDDRLRAAATQAREVGLKVMMKPHLWLRRPHWVGDITHSTEEAWAAWFGEYRTFLLHYARLARDTGMDALCIGNELERTSHREADWRRLIEEVRGVYKGPLTYGANTNEAFRVAFWDALDFIGLSAYFPLVDGRSPDRAALVSAWRPIVVRLSQLAARWDRKILFTELGYRSADAAAWRQWDVGRDAPVNLQLQADAYAAFFEAVWPQPWFAGVYWWKWFSSLEGGGPEDNDYTPLDKPAEKILSLYYGTW